MTNVPQKSLQQPLIAGDKQSSGQQPPGDRRNYLKYLQWPTNCICALFSPLREALAGSTVPWILYVFMSLCSYFLLVYAMEHEGKNNQLIADAVLIVLMLIGFIVQIVCLVRKGKTDFVEFGKLDHEHSTTYLLAGVYVFGTGTLLTILLRLLVYYHAHELIVNCQYDNIFETAVHNIFMAEKQNGTVSNSSTFKPVVLFGGFCYTDVIFDSTRLLFTLVQLLFIQTFRAATFGRSSFVRFTLFHTILTNACVWLHYIVEETHLFKNDVKIFSSLDRFVTKAFKMEEILTPFILEYSLIAAGILHSISSQMKKKGDDSEVSNGTQETIANEDRSRPSTSTITATIITNVTATTTATATPTATAASSMAATGSMDITNSHDSFQHIEITEAAGAMNQVTTATGATSTATTISSNGADIVTTTNNMQSTNEAHHTSVNEQTDSITATNTYVTGTTTSTANAITTVNTITAARMSTGDAIIEVRGAKREKSEKTKAAGSKPGLIWGAFCGLLLTVSSLLFDNEESKFNQRSHDFFLVYEGLLALLQVIIILWTLHKLQSHNKSVHKLRSEDTLLLIGYFGTFAFHWAALFSVIKVHHKGNAENRGAFAITTMHLIILVIAHILQTILVITSRRYTPKIGPEKCIKSTGKIRQCALFLLTTNLGFWALDSFVEMKDNANSSYPSGKDAFGGDWKTITAITYPFVVFFRFHSAEMLFEFWSRFNSKE